MKKIAALLAAAAGLFTAAAAQAALPAEGTVIPVWSGPPPGGAPATLPELTGPGPFGPETVVRNVSRPTLTVYRPDPERATGAAVIVAPGGGFRMLSINSEGVQVAKWLAERGVTAFVLRYRLAATPASQEEFRKEMVSAFGGGARAPATGAAAAPAVDVPALAGADGREAIRLVRSHAAEWNIDPKRIGIVGFSAGGSVVMSTVLNNDAASRPDFAAPIYSAVRGELNVPADAPPLFIAQAADDTLTRDTGSLRIYSAWREARKLAELHIFERGGHGFGMNRTGQTSEHWIDAFGWWLEARGAIKRTPRP